MRNLGVLLFLVGLALLAGCASADDKSDEGDARKIAFWQCAMHPDYQLLEPGKCGICKMDLVPVYEDTGEHLGPRQFRTTESAKALMDIQVTPVERRFVTARIRMVGKIDFDETRLRHISSRVAGRLDRLYVDCAIPAVTGTAKGREGQ